MSMRDSSFTVRVGLVFGEGPEEIDSYLPAAFYKILSDKGRRGLAEFVVNVSFLQLHIMQRFIYYHER